MRLCKPYKEKPRIAKMGEEFLIELLHPLGICRADVEASRFVLEPHDPYWL